MRGHRAEEFVGSLLVNRWLRSRGVSVGGTVVCGWAGVDCAVWVWAGWVVAVSGRIGVSVCVFGVVFVR